MKFLTRDTSAYRFMALGGLFSKKKLKTDLNVVPSILEDNYLTQVNSFGIDEENVRRYLMSFLKNQMGWKDVQKKHDILVTSGDDSMVIECKRFDSTLTYLDEHKGGSKYETCVEELHRNLKRFNAKWGILTDGVDFRLYYTSEHEPNFMDVYLEISLKDIMDSSNRWPEEIFILLDILSPNSSIRQNDPTVTDGVPENFIKKTVKILKDNNNSLRTVIKTLAVACIEDMGVRPLHHDVLSIKNAKTKNEYNEIFSSILDDDGDFHLTNDVITEKIVKELNGLFSSFPDIDFAHVDYEFFGVIYQKFINNGNASHYTNSKLSKEMATYIACRNDKSQKKGRPIFLEDGDYILDPSVGSGQLLRNLLPFYKVFFSGTVKGIDGWRELATHMMGRDIDPNAVWLSKINLWLATSKKGAAFVTLDEFKDIDVIEATINRRAGESINDALEIEVGNSVVAIVSNPPWDAFKNDSRRGITFDQAVVNKIKQSLSLTSRQLNRAQIFTKIIYMIGEENDGMRYSIVLPDSIFVDQNDDLRESLEPNLDFYFSYPRNVDPVTKVKIFPDVDNTRKFGILFGRSSTTFEQTMCYPFGGDSRVVLNENQTKIGDYNVFPLYSHVNQSVIVENWKLNVTRDVKWSVGEFDQSLWAKNEDRVVSANGNKAVLGGSSFCNPDSAWAEEPNKSRAWKKFSSVSIDDAEIASKDRTIFSDYINNSKKLNSATFLEGSLKCNLINTLLYSLDTEKNDWLIYDSAIFSTFVEVYGTSQHINAWRLTALGLPRKLKEKNALEANIELCAMLGIPPKVCMDLYDLNESWLSMNLTKKDWNTAFNKLYAKYLTGSKSAVVKKKESFDEIVDKRKVLASLIVDDLKDDSLGAVKLAKVFYLTDMELELSLDAKYVKDAAGPVDNTLFYNAKVGLFPKGNSSEVANIEKIKLKGKGNSFSKITSTPSTKKLSLKATAVFGSKSQLIKNFLKTFKPLTWQHCEAVATIYACWNDLLLSGKEPSEENILKDFYKWSPEKSERFDAEEVVKTMKWMRTKKIVPKGRGRKTAAKMSKEIPF